MLCLQQRQWHVYLCICVCMCVREREMPINEDVTYSCNSDVGHDVCACQKSCESKSTLDLATVCERPVS